MSNIWFTSDHHFGHANIIKYSNRPFASVEEMDETMINRWNERVGIDDEVYHLGDVGLASPNKLLRVLNELNGTIYLIKGNHEASALACSKRFEWIKDYHELLVPDTDAHGGERLIILMHYAMRVWNVSHHGSWHLYGHSHGSLPDNEASLSFDVGVDCHNFYPLSYQDVKNIMAKKKWVSPIGGRNL